MISRFALPVFAVSAAMVLQQCGGVLHTYLYRATNGNCNCEEYRMVDERSGVEMRFRASYVMNHGVATTVEIEFINRSRDTLSLDPGVAKITSRNVGYRFNDKFIPLPHLIIPPSRSDHVVMHGTDVAQEDDWNKIAGEQLTVTLKGISLGLSTMPQQSVTFIPENPKLRPAP
jgi:hypothetical protein